LCKSTGTAKIWFEFKPHAWTFSSIVHPKKTTSFSKLVPKSTWQSCLTDDTRWWICGFYIDMKFLHFGIKPSSHITIPTFGHKFPCWNWASKFFLFFEFWISLWHRMFYIYGLFVFQTQMKLGKMIPKLQQDEINAIIVKFNNQVLEN